MNFKSCVREENTKGQVWVINETPGGAPETHFAFRKRSFPFSKKYLRRANVRCGEGL